MTREQTYQLPINVIIEIMKGFHERVTLHARVPALPGILKQECVAHIVVDEHGLRACIIAEQGAEEKRLEAEEAFSILQRCGPLGWTLQVPDVISMLTKPPPERMSVEDLSGGQIPSRQVELTPAQMQTLPPAQKKVFALVNGRNSLEYIAHLLTRSPEEVYSVLLELKHQHLISLGMVQSKLRSM